MCEETLKTVRSTLFLWSSTFSRPNSARLLTNQRFRHLAQEVQAAVARLLQRIAHDVHRDAGDFDVHLQGGDTGRRAGHPLDSRMSETKRTVAYDERRGWTARVAIRVAPPAAGP